MKLLSKTTLMVLAGLLLTGCMFRTKEDAKSAGLSNKELVKRGEYLVTTSACHDCHSPKLGDGLTLDPDRILSGHPRDEKFPPIQNYSDDWIMFSGGLTGFVGPWGISYSANLTPDDTGTGSWTFEQFKTAIRKGKYKGLEGSRDLLPPMPWEMYKHFTDDDLRAIFTYLQSIKPVNNLVPPPVSREDLQLMVAKQTNP